MDIRSTVAELANWILMIGAGTLGAYFSLVFAPRQARRIARRKGVFDPSYERLSVLGLIRALLLAPVGPGKRSARDTWPG